MTRNRHIVAHWLILMLLGLSGNQLVSRVLAQSFTHQFDRSQTNTPAPDTAATFVTAGNTRLHYVEAGRGRPIVMIHGDAGDLHDFQFGVLDLLARNYHAIAFDLPGHGLSKMPRQAKGTIQEQAVTLHQALEALGIRNPILVGHSWGGGVALAYALSYPHDISALVLLAPAAYPDHRDQVPLSSLLRIPVLNDLCLALLKPILGHKLLKQGLKDAFSPDAIPDDYLKSAAVWLERKHLKAFLKNVAAANAGLQDLSPQYQKISAPVIIVTGDSDLLVSPQENAFHLNRVIAKSELLVIPHAGHQIPETHPEAVLRAVDMADSRSATLTTGQNN